MCSCEAVGASAICEASFLPNSVVVVAAAVIMSPFPLFLDRKMH